MESEYEIKKSNIDRSGSSGSGEADDFSVLSEAFSAQKEVVLSDEAHLAFAVSALSAILSESSGVGSPKQVRHLSSGYN